jgi:PrtD family type I secretion system ABC transporter
MSQPRSISLLLRAYRPFVSHAMVLSLFINVLAFAVPVHMLQVYDRVLSSGHLETLWVITGMVLIALVFQSLLDALRSRLLFGLGQQFEQHWRTGVFDLLVRDMAWKRQFSGSSPWGMVQSAKQFAGSPIMGAVLDAPWVPLYLVVIYLFHPLLGWVSLLGALLMLLFAIWNHRNTKLTTLDVMRANQQTRDTMDLTLRHAEAVLGLGMQDDARRLWQEQHNQLNQKANVGHARSSSASAISKFFRFTLQVLMLSLGAYLVIVGEMSAGAIVANSILLGRALAPIEQLSSGWKSVQEVWEALHQLAKLPIKPGDDQPPVATPQTQPSGNLQAENLFLHVGQPPRPLIKGVSFVLSPGDSLAIIGPSGGGKTTLLRLLLGIAEPTGGVCRFDGNETGAYGAAFFKQHVGYLPQQVMLFPGTVAQNIARMGELDMPLVQTAAQEAGCHEMIMQLPDGYDTPVGINGSNLSLGQQQRIGLARALYGQPRYVMLDEPNANLDADGDAALMQAMQRCTERGATVVCIAHRSSVLKHCNKVLLLRLGQVAAFGPRDEVLQKLAASNKGSAA